MSGAGIPTGAKTQALRAAVEDFLYLEADLLDSWRLDDWLELFADDAVYEVPATDALDGDPAENLFIIADTMEVLRGRVKRLKNVQAYAESPKSRTRRIVSNVRILGAGGGTVELTANFHISRVRRGTVDTFIGRYDHLLVDRLAGGPDLDAAGDARFVFRRRRALLDLDALRPQGKISFIL